MVSNFAAADWCIVVAYLSCTVIIGLYVNRYISSMSDYVVAGRSLKSFLAIATMIGTELGLVTVMYAGEKGFTGGFAAFHIGLVAGVVTLLVGITGFIVVPLREAGVMTIPEYYGKRFGSGVRILGGLLLAGGGILNMGLFLKAGAVFTGGLTGMTDATTINWIMTALLGLVLFYTVLGGMVSVVITDYIQFVVLSFGMFVACAMAVNQLGWTNIVHGVREIHGNAGFNPFVEGTGFGPSYVVWMVFTAGVVSCAVWQTAVMRACAAESTSVVRKLYIWSSVGFMIRFLVPQFLGLCALVYLSQHPDGQAEYFLENGSPNPEKTMEAMPVFLGQILPTVVIGLVGAGMLAAFMSTHDSYLLCWASVLVQDVLHPLSGHSLSASTRLLLARILIFMIGGFLLYWSLWYPLEQDLWDYMAVSGAIYFTGAFAVLLCGIYWRRASTFGAYAALLSGTLAVTGLKPVKAAVGLERVDQALGFETTSEHIGITVTIMALLSMFVGSLLIPDKKAPSDQHA